MCDEHRVLLQYVHSQAASQLQVLLQEFICIVCFTYYMTIKDAGILSDKMCSIEHGLIQSCQPYKEHQNVASNSQFSNYTTQRRCMAKGKFEHLLFTYVIFKFMIQL